MISIVAPAYNEEAVIEDFVKQVVDITRFVFKYEDWELIIVNDGSTDKTREILYRLQTEYPITIIDHIENCGLGKALETGFRNAKGDIIVTMDADCSHDPKLMLALCQEIVTYGCDVAIASRYVQGGCMENIPLWRQLLSRSGNVVMRTILRWPAKDSTSGYRAYRASVVKELHDLPNGFEVQAVILTRLKDAYIRELPFSLQNRTAGYSKMQYGKLAMAYLRMLIA